MSKLKLQATDGSAGTVSLKAPASTTGNAEFELTLPGNAGSNGQLLSTNGSGVLTWSDDNSGVSLSGSTNNTIATVTGANALVGEANLTFDGDTLSVTGANGDLLKLNSAGSETYLYVDNNEFSVKIDPDDDEGSSILTVDIDGSEKLRISNDGMVGIGMTPGTAGGSTYMLQVYNPGSQAFISIGNGTSGNGPINGIILGNDTGSAYLYNRENTPLAFGTNNTERVTIAADGKIGIGETSPSTLLNLKGTAGGGATGMKVVNTADEYTAVIMDANRNSANNALGIIDGRWNGNQNCAIYLTAGTDTTNKDDGAFQVHTRPSGGDITYRLKISSTGVWHSSLYSSNTNSGLSANIFVFSDGGMGRSSSSGKWKKNIETIQDSYADKILTMRPTWYQQDNTKVNIPQDQNKDWGYWGFIAEEVAAIDPRLVTWKVADYAKDPNNPTGDSIRTPLAEPEPDNVAYERFVPHLVNLLKRQATKIETLETKVATLEAS